MDAEERWRPLRSASEAVRRPFGLPGVAAHRGIYGGVWRRVVAATEAWRLFVADDVLTTCAERLSGVFFNSPVQTEPAVIARGSSAHWPGRPGRRPAGAAQLCRPRAGGSARRAAAAARGIPLQYCRRFSGWSRSRGFGRCSASWHFARRRSGRHWARLPYVRSVVACPSSVVWNGLWRSPADLPADVGARPIPSFPS